MRIQCTEYQELIISDFTGQEAELLAMLCYLRGIVDPMGKVVIDENIQKILSGIYYDS